MSESKTFSPGSARRYKDLVSLIGIKNNRDLRTRANALHEKLRSIGVDGESACALFQAYEERCGGNSKSADKRLENFTNFVSQHKDRTQLLENVNDLGMLSTDALEEYANETGNWMPLMVRRETIKKLQPGEAEVTHE